MKKKTKWFGEHAQFETKHNQGQIIRAKQQNGLVITHNLKRRSNRCWGIRASSNLSWVGLLASAINQNGSFSSKWWSMVCVLVRGTFQSPASFRSLSEVNTAGTRSLRSPPTVQVHLSNFWTRARATNECRFTVLVVIFIFSDFSKNRKRGRYS